LVHATYIYGAILNAHPICGALCIKHYYTQEQHSLNEKVLKLMPILILFLTAHWDRIDWFLKMQQCNIAIIYWAMSSWCLLQ